MYCTKCGKEIPDGEKKICDDCEKKLLQEITAEEKKEVKEEKTASKKETKEKAKKVSKEEKAAEKKTKKESKKAGKVNKGDKKEDANEWKVTGEKNKKKNDLVSVLFIAIILLLAIGGAFIISHLFTQGSSEGNTIGNIRNYGYAVEDGNWIYYLAPNEDSSQIGIFKVKSNGKGQELLYMSEIDIVSLNVYKNYIYFIGSGVEKYTETDELDNKIYRIKKDGSELEVLNDNEINNDCYEIYVIDDSIYYIGLNAEICKMDLNGSNKTVVADNGTGYLGINEDYIIYNKTKVESAESSESEGSTEFVTYIMNRDGSNQRPIIEGKRLYSVNIEENTIYYSDIDKKIYKTEIDSNEEQLLYGDLEAYNLNTSKGYAYYLDYLDPENEDYTVCIYRVKLDGSTEAPELIKKLDTYSSFIDVVGKWVIYMDSNSEAGFINLVSVDGKDEVVQLYYLDYSEYYEKVEESDYSDTSVDAGGEQTTTTEETTTNTEATENVVTEAANTVVENVVTDSTNTVAQNEVTNSTNTTVENTTTNTVQ
ncbi:MAG: DUF5050 domain-containing protein [Clostridia bacterium]|nr:DUF5050 domain-containing protein [Clostridia bacterium]